MLNSNYIICTLLLFFYWENINPKFCPMQDFLNINKTIYIAIRLKLNWKEINEQIIMLFIYVKKKLKILFVMSKITKCRGRS